VDEAAPAQYRALPRPEDGAFQNRFVRDHVLYGAGHGWGALVPIQGRLHVAAYATPDPATVIDLRHSVDRIEALGSDAVVVGTRGPDLHFTPIDLSGLPSPGRSYVRAGASQGELRSHGFFYKPEGERTGLLGLPIRGAGRPGYEHLFAESAAVLFVRNDGLRFTEAGELRPHTEGATADGCRASCVDWYGNARPLFLRGRLFALLGYELVEGQVDAGRIVERRRASFAPGVAAVSR